MFFRKALKHVHGNEKEHHCVKMNCILVLSLRRIVHSTRTQEYFDKGSTSTTKIHLNETQICHSFLIRISLKIPIVSTNLRSMNPFSKRRTLVLANRNGKFTIQTKNVEELNPYDWGTFMGFRLFSIRITKSVPFV